jgi:hypothetical protein
MRTYLRVGLPAILSLYMFSPATASQVMMQDLSGKKICFDSGLAATFGSDGVYKSGRLPGGSERGL